MKDALRLLALSIALVSACLADDATDTLRKSAEQGDARAQHSLGVAYSKGQGVTKDPHEAVKWYRKSADQGDARAQCVLGWAYARGEGVTKDADEAVNWFRKAADQGDADAQCNLGFAYANGHGITKDPVKAVRWYQKAATQGHLKAQGYLGFAYFLGEGVAQDFVGAARWFRAPADQGHAPIQLMLGRLYQDGNGVEKDSIEAAKWFRKAAYQGFAPAQWDLGVAYAKGEGLLKNSIEGLAWLNIAAMAGDESTLKDRDMLERRVGPEGTLDAQKRSEQLLTEIEVAKHAASPPLDSIPPTGSFNSNDNQNPKASGSGAIVTAEGHILTAAHVVAGAKRVTVITELGTKNATIVRLDEANDLAVLKITEGKYTPLPIASSRKVQLGQSISTIGFPNITIQGFSPKVTKGEISSLNGIGDDPRLWQISVPVQTGNSGGPVLDENGNLVGVVVSKLGISAAKITGDIPQNVNYAVKGAYALALLEPYLGTDSPEPSHPATLPRFEDMIAKAQQSVVLILAY